MTVQPLATPDSSFSDAIVCRFRLRPLAIDERQTGVYVRPGGVGARLRLHLRGAATGRGRRQAGAGRLLHLAVR